MTQHPSDQVPQEFDEHWAASREHCERIGKRIGKDLKRAVGPVDNSPLPFKCTYPGPQTTFSEDDGDE